MTTPTPQGGDFAPCRCGDNQGIVVEALQAPYQLRGNLFIAVCGCCGKGVPFVAYRFHGDSVMPDAIAAWNGAAALAASEARVKELELQLIAARPLFSYRYFKAKAEAAEQSLSAMQARVDGLEADAGRLDAITRLPGQFSSRKLLDGVSVHMQGHGYFFGSTPRDAIDAYIAAIAAQRQEPTNGD